MKILSLALLFTYIILSSSCSLANDKIGQIHTMKGDVTIIRGTTVLPANIGTPLQKGDLVRTGKPGAAGIVLTDDSTFSMGSNSELALKEYAFNPKEGKFSLVARMVKGTFAYLSGLIGKLSPDSIQLSIPDATIAIRGTKLLVEVQK